MIYLDNAATGFPKSPGVREAMERALSECGNPSRGSHSLSKNADEVLYRCRVLLAKQFGTLPEKVVLTKNATEALNLAIKGLSPKGGEVVTSDLEHNAVLRPLHALRAAREITLKQFRTSLSDDGVTVENFRTAVGSTAGLAVVTHASNVCGRILPLKAMREAVDRKDFLMIADCSQTAGHIPIDITELGVDVICIPGHKGLYGPMGTGALICHPARELAFRTLVEGGSGVHSRSLFMPEELPERLEAGTPNVYGFAGLAAALSEFSLPQKENALFGELEKALREKQGIRIHGYHKSGRYVPVLLFNKQGVDCEVLAERLAEKGIAVRGGLHCAPAAHRTIGTGAIGGVRVSLGRANTALHLEALLEAL